jgi:hypothetical protein
MKNVGVFIFCMINLYLLYFYIFDIHDFLSGKYNYDGWKYLIPLAISDSLFFICLVCILISIGINKYFYIYVLLVIAHNLAVGTGIQNFPFVGFFIVILTFIYVFKFDKSQPRTAKSPDFEE